jgi:hypothetical protein
MTFSRKLGALAALLRAGIRARRLHSTSGCDAWRLYFNG